MTTSGISNNSLMDYEGWVSNANAKAESMQNKVNSTSSTSGSKKTGSTSSVDTSSSSVFLMNYQMQLTDLEAASAKLQLSKEDNVFSKYESALSDLNKAVTDDERKAAQEAVDKAKEDIKTAMTDFADQFNKTMSFLESNSGRSSTVENHLASMKRSLMTNNALKTVGLSTDAYGKLHVDEKGLDKALNESYAHVKETMGGQFGIAERVGSKATSVLDSPVDKIVGSGSSTKGTNETENKDNTSSSNSSSSNKGSSALSSASMPDSLTSFYNFTKAGAFNLSNYYAVGMLMNTIG